nr:unnamed protein product [Spirometra erinaceieuropaei]
MDLGGVVCVKCRRIPTNPRSMLCGHTFCLHPCLLPANFNQNLARCPLCHIETPLAYLEPGNCAQLPPLETHSICPECRTLCVTFKFCQHCSKEVCPMCMSLHQAEVLASLMKKLSNLRSKSALLASLKATLSQLKSNKDSCKERLLSEVTSAVEQLQRSADSALEKAKLVVTSTSTEDQARLKKLEDGLEKLMHRQTSASQMVDDIQQGKKPAVLNTLTKSTGKLRCKLRRLTKSVELCKVSDISIMRIADKFETIQLQLQNLRLFAPDTALPLEPDQIRHLTTHPSKNEMKQKARLNTIYLGCLPQSANELKLYDYFSTFGVVDKVSVSNGRQTDRSGNVVFRDLKSAKKVLEFQSHRVDGTQIIVARTMKALAELIRSKNEMKQKAQLNKIHLGCLPQSANELKLYEYFSEFGVVDEVRVSKARETRGSGYVVFHDLKSAKKVLEFQPHRLDGTQIIVARTMKALAELIRSKNEMKQKAQLNKIYLGCLPQSVNRLKLYEYFSKFGAVDKVSVSKGPQTDRSGYVVFRDLKSAKKALEFQLHELDETKIVVAHDRKALAELIRSMNNNNKMDRNAKPNKIFLGCLPNSANEHNLYEYFSKFGAVNEVYVSKAPSSRGCGYVVFRYQYSAEAVLESRPHHLNDTQIIVARVMKTLSSRISLLTRLQLPSNTSQALPATSLPPVSDATEAPKGSFSLVNSSSNQPVTT